MPKKELRVSSAKLIVALLIAVAICVATSLIVWYSKPSVEALPIAHPDTKPEDGDSDFPNGTAPWTNLRLPLYTLPRHYDVTLYPDFYDGKDRFYGTESIEIEVKMNTNYLIIHYKQMNITESKVTDAANLSRVYEIVDQFAYEENQFWIVKTKQVITAGRIVTLSLQFDGSLSNGMVGLYKSSYSIGNETRYLATSKFEPVDARKAFPCFDEPNLKATFSIRLRHRLNYIALSNMPKQSHSTVDGSLVETVFEKSVVMSTYLVCFIVCDFGYKEATLKSGKPFRVYATKDKVDQVDYALAIGVSVTNYYEDFFGLAYPLPKQDMIAIPDFISGAMEHWGLITYRETNLLYKEGQSSAANKQRVATVVSHELSHQWFGNIVTMDWWDDLWLNEGFASYMEYIGVNDFETSWDMYGQILTEDAFPVMLTDSKDSSHPIVVSVSRPEQITEVFDSISYSKGAAIINMLEDILGEAVFRSGLKSYLRKYRYKNAVTDDLWDSFSAASDDTIDVKAIMDTWTKQMGFPVVQVAYDRATRNVTLTQTRFLNKKPANLDSPFGYTWAIALRYSTSSKGSGLEWMLKDGQALVVRPPVDLNSNETWIKFNTGSMGFYRVNYPDEYWKRFEACMQTLPQGDRAGLINDALNLARSGYLSYSVALSLVTYLANESEYTPWMTAISPLNYIGRALEARNETENWQFFAKSLLKTVYTDDVWSENRTHLQLLLSDSIIRMACSNGKEECMTQVHAYFRTWIDGAQIPAGIRRVVYYFAMRNSTETEWNQMWDAYLKETANPNERLNLLYGLAQTRNATLLERYLEYCWDPSKIRDQDFFTVVTYISGNPVGNPIAWKWVQDNWPRLVDRFKIDNRNLGRLVPDIVSGYATEKQLKEVNDFFVKYPESGAGARGRDTAIESIENNIAWSDKYIEEIKQALAELRTRNILETE